MTSLILKSSTCLRASWDTGTHLSCIFIAGLFLWLYTLITSQLDTCWQIGRRWRKSHDLSFSSPALTPFQTWVMGLSDPLQLISSPEPRSVPDVQGAALACRVALTFLSRQAFKDGMKCCEIPLTTFLLLGWGLSVRNYLIIKSTCISEWRQVVLGVRLKKAKKRVNIFVLRNRSWKLTFFVNWKSTNIP